MVSSVSSGGMQLESLQIIHSSWAVTVPFAVARCTFCAKRGLPERVPICIPNSSS